MTPYRTLLVLIDELNLSQRPVIVQPLLARHPAAHQRRQPEIGHMIPAMAVESEFAQRERRILVEETDLGARVEAGRREL